MADPSGIAPPYLDPSQYPDYLQMQRKQMLAQMLMQNTQSAGQTPGDWDSMKVVPRKGLMSSIAPIASALLASKGMKGAQDAQSKYFQGLYGPSQQAPQGAPGQSPQGFNKPLNDPSFGMPSSPGLLPQQSPPQNPLLGGMDPHTAQAVLGMMGPEKYGSDVLAPNLKPAEIRAQIRAAGIDPDSRQGRQMALSALNKATQNVQDVRPGGTLFDMSTRQPLFTAPNNGTQTQWGPDGQPNISTIPGALEATQAATAATTAGSESQKPIKLGTDANGKEVYGFPTPPAAIAQATHPGAMPGAASKGPYFNNATAGGQTASPATMQAQKTGAEQGQHYASELSKNATGATEVRRSLSELKNLASQATPSALNEGKMKMGSYMIAAGADPKTVAGWMHVDIGALQAAQKQTSTLAVNTIHSMTSRGTNFDLDTFMRNNPNLNMADPTAFNRVVEYMDNKSKQEIAKQKDFAQWKQGKSPDDWETGHTAHWLDQQNQSIEQGKSNSAVPSGATKSIGGKMYVQKNGKWYEQ